MWHFLIDLWRTRTTRPYFYWVLLLVAYIVVPTPAMAVVLVAGLGAAVAVSAYRVRDAGRRRREAEVRAAAAAGLIPTGATRRRPAYDPGVLLSAVVSVLAAEGLPVDASYGLDACINLLRWQDIRPVAGAPSPTARGLVGTLGLGPSRPVRAMPPVMLAKVVAAVLVADGVMPPNGGGDASAQALMDACVLVLDDMGIVPAPSAGTAADWPVVAQIIDAAAEHVEGY